MISRTWLFVGLGAAALGVGYYLIKVKPARDAEGVRESSASRDMIKRVAAQGAARRVTDVIAAGPKPGVRVDMGLAQTRIQGLYRA
jgi:hypothetical protein